MKNIIVLLAFILGATYVQAQTTTSPEKVKTEYQKTIKINPNSQKQIYYRLKMWVHGNLKNKDNILKLDDENHSFISIDAHQLILNQKDLNKPSVHFTLTITLKDGTVHYTINEMFFRHFGNGMVKVDSKLENIKNNNWGEMMSAKKQDEIRKEVEKVIPNLIEFLSKITTDEC